MQRRDHHSYDPLQTAFNTFQISTCRCIKLNKLSSLVTKIVSITLSTLKKLIFYISEPFHNIKISTCPCKCKSLPPFVCHVIFVGKAGRCRSVFSHFTSLDLKTKTLFKTKIQRIEAKENNHALRLFLNQ